MKKLLTKEIESYGIIKLTETGKEFIHKPQSFKITEDHDYEESTTVITSNQKGTAADEMLFNILKDVRKKS